MYLLGHRNATPEDVAFQVFLFSIQDYFFSGKIFLKACSKSSTFTFLAFAAEGDFVSVGAVAGATSATGAGAVAAAISSSEGN